MFHKRSRVLTHRFLGSVLEARPYIELFANMDDCNDLDCLAKPYYSDDQLSKRR